MIQITSKWTTESAGRYLVEPCSVEILEGWAFRVDAEWFHPETGGIQVLHLVSNIRRLGKQWLFNVRLKDKLVLHCSFDKTIWDAKCQKKISQLLLEKRYRVLREKCVFRKNLQYFANWAAIGCPKNDKPIRVWPYTQISWVDELPFYMQGIGCCSELGKIQFSMNTK